MKTSKQVKVKAWAVVHKSKKGTPYIGQEALKQHYIDSCTIFEEEIEAKDYLVDRKPYLSIRLQSFVVPCTITYYLPSKPIKSKKK